MVNTWTCPHVTRAERVLLWELLHNGDYPASSLADSIRVGRIQNDIARAGTVPEVRRYGPENVEARPGSRLRVHPGKQR